MSFKRFFLMVVFFLAGAGAFCSAIGSFKIEGLRKTKEEYLQKVLSRFEGREIDPQTLHEIETTLHAEGLFETIEVKAPEASEEETQEITVTVKEKITFVPLPFLAVSNGDWMGGAMVLNMNAFGNKSLLMAGGFVSATTLTGMTVYSKPPANTKDFGYSISASVNHNKIQYADLKDEIFTEFGQTGAGLRFSLSKKITDFTTLSSGIGGSWNKYSKKKNYPLDTKNSAYLSYSVSGDHGKSDWNEWFLNNKHLGLSYRGSWELYNNDYSSTLSGSLVFQQPFTKKFRFCSTVSGVYTDSKNINEWNGGGGAAVAILPSKFVSPEMYGGNAGLELALKKFGFGLFSIYGNYQACWFKNLDDNYKMCQGVEFGTRLYLSKIAFPAFVYGMNKNITTGKYNYSMSIGISM